MRGEALGVERRRRWSDEHKLSILSEVGLGGATVTQVAQRHEITRQQIYGWRSDLRRRGLWNEGRTLFLPLELGRCLEAPAVAEPALASACVEIILRNGRQLRFPSGLDDDALARLIRVVETA